VTVAILSQISCSVIDEYSASLTLGLIPPVKLEVADQYIGMDYPTGAAAIGMRLFVQGAMDGVTTLTDGQFGVLLPSAGGTIGFPNASSLNEGMIVYHAGTTQAPVGRGHKLKLSDGNSWYPVGNAQPFTISTRPPASDFGAGVTIWVQDESDTKRLQYSDGASWRQVKGAEQFTTATRPTPSFAGGGAQVYVTDEPAPIKRLQVSDGTSWHQIRGAEQFTAASRPTASSVGAGSLIYVTDEPDIAKRLQISDGSSWRGITTFVL